MEKETLTAEEFTALMEGKPLVTHQEAEPKPANSAGPETSGTEAVKPEKRENTNIGGPEPVLRFNHSKD